MSPAWSAPRRLPPGSRAADVEVAALELPCPRCGAGIKQACVVAKGWAYRRAAATHVARWRAGRAALEERESVAGGRA